MLASKDLLRKMHDIETPASQQHSQEQLHVIWGLATNSAPWVRMVWPGKMLKYSLRKSIGKETLTCPFLPSCLDEKGL